MTVRTVHRFTACLLLVFLAAHLVNHLVAICGVPAHIEWMHITRAYYREPFVEFVLLTAFGVQMITGITRLVAGWRTRTGGVAWLQAATGGYLLLFLLIHISAVLAARSDGVDTNFHFAAAGMHAGLGWFFVPYYAAAVASVFIHLGCATYWQMHDKGHPAAALNLLWTMAVVGAGLAAVIVALLAGLLVPVDIPASYLAPFQ